MERTALEDAVVRVGRGHAKAPVREVPKNSNRGAPIDAWNAFTGAKAGSAYCASAISYWVLVEAPAGLVGVTPLLKKSAGALNLIAKNAARAVTGAEAKKLLAADVPLIGAFAVGDQGKGHALVAHGLVGDKLRTVEANTNPGPEVPAKDREGNGVYERADRLFGSVHHWVRIA